MPVFPLRAKPALGIVLLAVGLTVVSARLFAHALSVSYAQFSVQDRSVQAVLRLPIDDLDLVLRLDRNIDGTVSDSELEASKSIVGGYLTVHLHVEADGAPLALRLDRLVSWRDPAGAEYVEADLTFAAPRTIQSISIRSDFLVELYPRHKTLGEMRIAGRSDEFVFEPGRVYEGRARGRLWQTALSFLRLGAEHIFTGYDHILFLFGLLLVGTGLRNLVAVVTSFTIAHSLTLALATLGVVQPTPWTVEAAIALSIAYIGFENLSVKDPRHRWRIAFVFGLIHGFGFAAVLRDMHLQRAGLAVSLFSFNAGVEMGQITIVSLMYPLLSRLARTPYRLLVTRVASSIILVVGLIWFYQRIP